MTDQGPRVLVLGASGRLGAILRRHWGGASGPQNSLTPLWQVRSGPVFAAGQQVGEAYPSVSTSLVFDPLCDIPACGPVDVVLGLAGVVPGKGDLALNTDLACATVRLGAALGAAQVFVTSSAAVYGGGPVPFAETGLAQPVSAYGRAKLAMEQAALALGVQLGVPVCALRIGNVAGADALLAAGGGVRVLDCFADGQGPRRSYIGPMALARVLAGLAGQGARGLPLPPVLNVALDGPVAMEGLCAAAGLGVDWRDAPATALACVVQDVALLAGFVSVARANAVEIVADWRTDQGCV